MNREVWPMNNKTITQSIETFPVEVQMWDLLDRDLKAAVINMLKELK